MHMVTRAIFIEPKFNKGPNLKIVIFQRIQKWCAPSEPDFYAISKMVHEIFVRQKLAKLQTIFYF